MLALDSNVLLRFLTQDDSEQTPIVNDLVSMELSARNPGYISLPVLCETVWTLRRLYRFSPAAIEARLREMLETAELQIAEEAALVVALQRGRDLMDLIHELGRRAGCTETLTFDRRFARLDGVRLLGT